MWAAPCLRVQHSVPPIANGQSTNKSALAPLTTAPSILHSDALHHVVLWATELLLPSQCPAVPTPNPSQSWPWLTGADSAKQSRPSGSQSVDPGQSLQEWTDGRGGGEPIHQPVTKSLLSTPPPTPEDLVPWRVAQWGPRRGEDGSLYLVAVKDVKLELFAFGSPPNMLTQHHWLTGGTLSTATNGCHGEVYGRWVGSSQGRILKLYLRSLGYKIKIMSAAYKKQREEVNWNYEGIVKLKPTPLVLPSPPAPTCLSHWLAGVGAAFELKHCFWNAPGKENQLCYP